MKQGQETNQIWTQEAGTDDTQQNPDIQRDFGHFFRIDFRAVCLMQCKYVFFVVFFVIY